MNPLEKHYRRWRDPDLVKRFAHKEVKEFFSTETRFLEHHGRDLASMLDIGCASGRMIELVQTYNDNVAYSGIDIVPENIELARRTYPEAEFHLCNALEFSPGRRYDLVNATGVCQHEPQFEALVRRMADLSTRYVMFDAKLASVSEHVIDIDRCYCSCGDERLYYVLLSWPHFREFLLSLPGVAKIEVFGYTTPPSRNAQLPRTINHIASVGCYLSLGVSVKPEMSVELPDWVSAGARTD